jgi:hypothetical protein
VADQEEPRGPVALHARLSPDRTGRVWWRYSWLLLTALAAITLVFFSLFQIGLNPSPHVSFRQQNVWQSTETLVVVGSGFPASPSRVPGPSPPSSNLRLTSLTSLYAQLATSPPLRALVLKNGPLHGRYDVAATQTDTGTPPPLLRIEGQAASPAQATRIAARVSRTLRGYINQQQTIAHIPQIQRIQLVSITAPRKPARIQSHWRKGPLIALGIVMTALLLGAVMKFRDEHP